VQNSRVKPIHVLTILSFLLHKAKFKGHHNLHQTQEQGSFLWLYYLTVDLKYIYHEMVSKCVTVHSLVAKEGKLYD
jgi:hypothetical protein